ncbi:hypothetical protein [Mucilaginibacter antarcticus]|uniref:Nuclear transport factor 2 family protein n=1 Tax=Mucilaginibacter antarcticus TaxID=1855725 RepID=A0ABW5XQJ4_9SPHI
MKTLKTIFLGLALLVVSTATFAAKSAASLSKEEVINMYVAALTQGKIDGVENILHRDVKHTLHRGEKEFNLNKKQILESLKANANVKQACEVNTTIMEEGFNGTVVKVTMKFEGYTRTNLITISNNKDATITKIETLA